MDRNAVLAAVLSGFALTAMAAPAWSQTSAPTPHPGQEAPKPEAPATVRSELLDRLFGQLHQARSEPEAKIIAAAIWKVWRHSGDPTADLLLTQAEKAMNARAFPTALAILDTVIHVKPDFAEAWNARATTYFLMRRFDDSLADIKRVLQLEPRHFGALAGRGEIMRALGKDRQALKAYRRALAIYPEMPGPRKAVKELSAKLEQNI